MTTDSMAAARVEGAPESAVAWSAVIAGALVASAFALALLSLGAGIGLVSISPWSSNGLSVTTFGVLAAAWFIATQLFASGVGGYLAGRMRRRWAGSDRDEIYFRDTAHGLLVWALGAVITAGLLASAASSAVGAVGHAGASALQTAGASAGASSGASGSAGYFVDLLFRSDHPAPGDAAASQAEAGRILAVDAASAEMPASDRTYLAQIVAARTGLSQADAEKRVDDVVARAKGAADAARKTGVFVALWAFISLLVGAFSASYMAAVGGQIRDEA